MLYADTEGQNILKSEDINTIQEEQHFINKYSKTRRAEAIIEMRVCFF